MSHLNVAYLYGMKRAAADFAQKLAELQATAPPRPPQTPQQNPPPQTSEAARQAPKAPPMPAKREIML